MDLLTATMREAVDFKEQLNGTAVELWKREVVPNMMAKTARIVTQELRDVERDARAQQDGRNIQNALCLEVSGRMDAWRLRSTPSTA